MTNRPRRGASLSGPGLIIRWSWRDLRARWVQVGAIAMIIAIGSGTYSGLSSVSKWRLESYDESYAELTMYDLHFVPVGDADFDETDARRAVEAASNGDITAFEPRLVVPTQVDASEGDRTVLAQARLVGVDVGSGGPTVGRLHATQGRVLRESDAGTPRVGLDDHFANEHDLPANGTLQLGSGDEVEWVGRVLQPEYFMVLGESGDLFAARNYAVMFAPLDWLQTYTDRPGMVNDLVVTVRSGADVDRVEASLVAALGRELPDIEFEITRREDDRVLRLMYDDVDGDQKFYDIFAALILLAAAFGALNLTARVVEAQRREIGIQMALGVPRRDIALRPLLHGLQVALLGAVLGVGVGLVMCSAMRSLLAEFFPLPIWRTRLQLDMFATGAALGVVVPLVATLLPVWRAVRVTPVDAIRTSHRTASSGLAPLVRKVPLPGSSTAQLPVRNVLRTPRRTVFTAAGVAAALATLVAITGMVDSFLETIDQSDREILKSAPDRLTVALDFFHPDDAGVVSTISESPLLASAEPQLRLPATLDPEGDEIDLFVQFVDLASPVWRPTATQGALRADRPGIVLARKAADDLGVTVGDSVALRHPRRVGLGYELVNTDIEVVAIHPNPYRFVAYIDRSFASIADLEGIVNAVSVVPAEGVTSAEVQRGLFGLDGVASVQPIVASAESIRSRIEEVLGIFLVIQGAVLVMALLIAFNSSAINVDERRREHATMFAFGVRVRRVLAMTVTESVLIGGLGTIGGIVLGRLLLGWLTGAIVPSTLPEVGIVTSLSGTTIIETAVLGIVAVSVAPLLTVRRLRRMDIASTLRVVE